MRSYDWADGNPGYIAAEVAVRDPKGSNEARSWAADRWNGPYADRRIISRSEALMRPTARAALQAWERSNSARSSRNDSTCSRRMLAKSVGILRSARKAANRSGAYVYAVIVCSALFSAFIGGA